VVFATPQPKRAAEIHNKLKTHLLTSKLKEAEEAEEVLDRASFGLELTKGFNRKDAAKKLDEFIEA